MIDLVLKSSVCLTLVVLKILAVADGEIGIGRTGLIKEKREGSNTPVPGLLWED
jgi:hypothetical protein